MEHRGRTRRGAGPSARFPSPGGGDGPSSGPLRSESSSVIEWARRSSTGGESMRSQRRGIAAGLLRIVPAGGVAWGLIGCDSPPDIVPIAPPGAQVPRKAPDEEPAQAQGEMAAPALQATTPATQGVEYTQGPPTATAA